MRIAVFPGSFDPITNGHLDLMMRAGQLFDQVIIAVANNERKLPLFTLSERVALIEAEIQSYPNIIVKGFADLLADFAVRHKASAVIRGLRAVSDFEYEFQLANMNRHLMPTVETLFLSPALEYSFLSSSLVKEVTRFGGDVSAFVPRAVQEALSRKFRDS